LGQRLTGLASDFGPAAEFDWRPTGLALTGQAPGSTDA
jgi:hypothetical protein